MVKFSISTLLIFSSLSFGMDYPGPNVDKPISIICLPDKKVAIAERGSQFVFDQLSRKYLSHIKTREDFLSLGKKPNYFTISDLDYGLKTNANYWSSDFTVDPAFYAPDGNTVIIANSPDYFICNLEDETNPLRAHQLIEDNCDYTSHQFHPCNSIIALLTTNNCVHFFDYKTLAIIAKAKKLSWGKEIYDLVHYPRLDFDENGTSLAVALKDTWKMIDVPQNNLLAVYMALQHRLALPKELVKHIVMNIIDSHKDLYAYFDLKALLNVTNITPVAKNEDPMIIEQQPKEIKAVYKRPLKNYAIYDNWGSSSAHNGMLSVLDCGTLR